MISCFHISSCYQPWPHHHIWPSSKVYTHCLVSGCVCLEWACQNICIWQQHTIWPVDVQLQLLWALLLSVSNDRVLTTGPNGVTCPAQSLIANLISSLFTISGSSPFWAALLKASNADWLIFGKAPRSLLILLLFSTLSIGLTKGTLSKMCQSNNHGNFMLE